MRLNRTLALGASLLMLLSACSTGGAASPSAAAPASQPAASQPASASAPASQAALPTIKIGSDGFYESKVVAEMYAQVLEKAGYKVDRHLGIGARQVRQPALEQGQIDLT